MSIHINALEVENVKRVQAVTLTPSATGLTVIGGKNGQGKSSVLDAIAWGLGGDRFRPEIPQRQGANTNPRLKLTLSNGLIVERKGARSALTVTDPTGKRHGQQLLNSFVETFALDLPRFMAASDKDKANTLLRIIGVGPQLLALDQQGAQLRQDRLYTGQQQRKAAAHADSLPFVPDTPEEEVSATDLIRQQQAILAQNAQNQRLRGKRDQLRAECEAVREQIDLLQDQLRTLELDYEAASNAADNLTDQSTAELEANLYRIDQINQAVRTNKAKAAAKAEADRLAAEYQRLSSEIVKVEGQRTELLNGADLPLPGLEVTGDKLFYKGQPWGNMSGAEQLIVSTAIVRRLNPECGFVLLDKLEQMDVDTLESFGKWLEQEGLQAIATRVSTGDECSIIIADGMARTPAAKPTPVNPNAWKKGAF